MKRNSAQLSPEQARGVIAAALSRAEANLLQAQMERIVAEEGELAARRVVQRVAKLLPKERGTNPDV
jgi:hypothetical protein